MSQRLYAPRSRFALIPACLSLAFLVFSCLAASASAAAGQSPAPKPAAPATAAVTSATQAAKMTELDKINYLIKAVEVSGLTFIRNGSEYNSKKAADHLRDKLNYALKHPKKGVDITARNFITLIASKSSLWGTPYKMKFKDGKTMPTGEWLTKKLDELEKGKAPARATPSAAKTPPAPPVIAK